MTAIPDPGSGLPGSVAAAVATDPGTTELRQLRMPSTGPDDGMLRVEATAVSGKDWRIYQRQSRGAQLGPVILGREIVGRVAELGEWAAQRWDVSIGDRVVVEEFLPCGVCRLCRSGAQSLCRTTNSYGSTPVATEPALYGGFGEYLYLHPRAMVHRVGPDVPAELATLYVPIANGIRWVVREGGLTIGQTLVVIGPGQHGLACVLAGREAGAGRIIVIGTRRDGSRLAVARALGADHTLFADEDPATAVADLTGGVGADVVVDLAAGEPGTVEDAIAMCAPRGSLVLAASKHGRPVTAFPHDLVVRKELRLIGVRGGDHRSVIAALELIRTGRHRLGLLATHRFPLRQTADALELAGRRADPSAIHVTVRP
ncbi:MAG TPA: zinc-binding dehydrogenase [Pseudonocardiaceae bacterium]|jgi:threonine dehydrogenase-like Zn-dependent dehydrogenase|nr:zinc-binding dehydrogenase [Pseudonocardiaceae bacterium]